MLKQQQGSGLIITILLTLVVMTIGVYTLSKTKPFSENIQGLEQSVQARYHAKTGEEVAKLIYYSDAKKAEAVLDDPDFATKDSDEKSRAFCRTDGSVLVNDRVERQAIADCIERKRELLASGVTWGNGSTSIEDYCASAYEEYLPDGYVASDTPIIYTCADQETNAVASPVADSRGGVDTRLTAQTTRIPQSCQGDSSLSYSTDGWCQNWNKLVTWSPVRINLSNIDGLSLDESGFTGGNNYSFSIRFRVPDIVKDTGSGDNPDETLYLTVDNKDDPMVLWNIYDSNIAFFPADADSSITRLHISEENSALGSWWNGNNGTVDGEWTSGRSLGNTAYKGVWEESSECLTEKANPASTAETIETACTRTLIDFFENELGGCIHRQCFLELQLVGDLSLWVFDSSGDPIPDTYHPDGIEAPYLEYQVMVGNSGGTSGGDELEINDTRPVITSKGESAGYSIQTTTVLEEELLIPTASSPIGR